MNTWYTKALGNGTTASVPADEIKETVLSLTGERPLDLAVFTRLESEGRLHCEVVAYFSPAAKDVAKAFEAQPCGKPARMGLDLLAGDEQAWSALFPENAV